MKIGETIQVSSSSDDAIVPPRRLPLISYRHEHLVPKLEREYQGVLERNCIKLKIPLIYIYERDDDPEVLGFYLDLPETIGLSSKLFEQYAWKEAMDFFGHEIAHQLAVQIFKWEIKGDDRDHDCQAFKKACELINLPHRSRESCGWSAR